MIWTYRLTSEGTSREPKPVYDQDAVREWLRIAVSTPRGCRPYLPEKYGIDLVKIINGTDPAYYLEESIRETCSLRDDITVKSCKCWQEGRKLYADVECQTIYGDFTLNRVLSADLERL